MKKYFKYKIVLFEISQMQYLFFFSFCMRWHVKIFFMHKHCVFRRMRYKNGNIMNGCLGLYRNAYIYSPLKENWQVKKKHNVNLWHWKHYLKVIHALELFPLFFQVRVIFEVEKFSFHLTCTIALWWRKVIG